METMCSSRIATTLFASVFLSLASFSLTHAQTVLSMPGESSGSGFSSGPSVNNANEDCPAPDRNNKYDSSKGKQWQEWDNTLKTFRTITNLHGKSCPTTVPGVDGKVEGKCVAQDDCKYAGAVKVPDVPAGDTTGAGGTPNQTGENTPWKPVEQKTPEEINNAFENGTKPLEYMPQQTVSSGNEFQNYLNQSYGITPENTLGEYGYSGFQSGQSILEQTLNPVSSFNSDYLSMQNTSSIFPQSSGVPQGLESPNAGNGYNPGVQYAPPTYQSTGFNPASTNGLALNPSSGSVTPFPTAGNTAAPFPFAPSASDPWAIQTPTPNIPTAPEPQPGNQIANSGVFTAPASTNWAAPTSGSSANAPMLYPYNAANQIAANFAPGQVGQQLALTQTNPADSGGITAQDIANATTPPMFKDGGELAGPAALPVSLNGGWANTGATALTNFDTSSLVSGANDWWVNGPSGCTNIACAVNIGAESPYVAFGPTPEQLGTQTEAGQQFDANGNAVAPPPPPIVASGQAPTWVSTVADGVTGFDAKENSISDKLDVGGVKVAEGNTDTATDARSPTPWDKIVEKPANNSDAFAKLQEGVGSGQVANDSKAADNGAPRAVDEIKKDALAPTATGIATAYNPEAPGERSGGKGLATGGEYDPDAWEVAIRKDIGLATGCGVGGGSVCYALVESPDGKAAIVQVTDNGPLSGRGIPASEYRVVDLNQRVGEYFSGQADSNNVKLDNMKVTLLSGGDYQLGPVTGNESPSDLPYSSRPAGSYIDQQPLQNASYYGGDVANTSVNMNGGGADNGTIADWNAGFAAVPPTLAAEYNGTVADWNAGFASVPATLATEQNGSVDDWNAGYAAVPAPLAPEFNGTAADWNAGFAAVPAPLAAEYNGTIADWNAGYAAVPQPLAAEHNGTVEDWYAGFGAVPPTLAAEQNGTVADWNAGFAAVPDAQPTVSVPGEMKISDVPPSGTDKPVDEVRLPPPRPEITVNDVPLPTSRPAVAVNDVPVSGPNQPADEVPLPRSRPEIAVSGIPLPPERPESALLSTTAGAQEAAQQPPLERLANPDAKAWNSIEENSGNAYDTGGQKLVTLTCSGGGGVCGPDQKIAASGSTASGEWIAVPANNAQGIKLGDKVDVQVGDKVIQNVMVADYTPANRNNYVASGELEKSLGGTGRDAALITPSAPEVPLPTPRPQDIDGNGNPIEQAAPVFVQEKEIPLEERIPVPTWRPEIFTAESGKDIEAQVKEATSPQDLAVGGYNQAPPDSLNPAVPTETIIPDKNLAYLDDMAPNDLLVSHEQVAAEIANDQAARTFGDEEATVVAPEAKEPDLSVANLSYLNVGDAPLPVTDEPASVQAPEKKEPLAATAIGEGEAIPLPQSRPDVTGARVQEAVGDAHSALQDVRDSTDQLEKVLKDPNSYLNNFKRAGDGVLESLKESRPVLQEAKQAALDAGDQKLADKIQTSINRVNTSIARINSARNQIDSGIKEALNDPIKGWVGRAYIEQVAMERLRNNPKLDAGLARLRGIWIQR